jgi:hypothetical protein
MKALFVVLMALALISCATPITNNKGTGGIPISADSGVGKDLIAAAFNLDNAIAIGVLPSDDPAASCIHGVLKQAGIETPPGAPAVASFVPQDKGAVSVGAIAYIRAQQLRDLKGLTVPVGCEAIIGKFVVDGLATANKIAIGSLIK